MSLRLQARSKFALCEVCFMLSMNCLSFRGSLDRRKVIFIDDALGVDEGREEGLFARVIKYALCHHTQHLMIDLQNNWGFPGRQYPFFDMFGSIFDCNLETLELGTITLDIGWTSSSLRVLTKSFTLEDPLGMLEFSELTLSTLEYADVCVDFEYKYMDYHYNYVTLLFKGLNNAMSLMLRSSNVKELRTMSEFLENQPSPFTSLKSLTMEASHAPFPVINYFLKKPVVKFNELIIVSHISIASGLV